MPQDNADLDQHFVRVVDTLTERFAGTHDRDTVTRVVSATRARLESAARVTSYLPVLTSRHAADELAGRTPAAARDDVSRSSDEPRP